jgi:hypothetical protein
MPKLKLLISKITRRPPEAKEQPNRTVRTSPRVFSYYTSNRRELDGVGARFENTNTASSQPPHRFARHKWVLIVCLLVGLACAVQLLRLSPTVSLVVPEQEPLLRSSAYYQTAFDTKLASSLFNRSKLTFSAQKFRKWIESTYPEIDSAQVHIDLLGKRPRVALNYLQPTALFETSGQQLVLAPDGTVLLPATE